jgi:peptidoglycan/xylan/chitin deacetylase (PgdA/CDA1 family)
MLSDERARDEILTSRLQLETRLGRPVTCFCYPGGRYGDREVTLVQQSGYRAAVTTQPGVNPGARPLERLRRSMIGHDDDRARFTALLDGLLDDIDPIPRALRRLGLLKPRAEPPTVVLKACPEAFGTP